MSEKLHAKQEFVYLCVTGNVLRASIIAFAFHISYQDFEDCEFLNLVRDVDDTVFPFFMSHMRHAPEDLWEQTFVFLANNGMLQKAELLRQAYSRFPWMKRQNERVPEMGSTSEAFDFSGLEYEFLRYAFETDLEAFADLMGWSTSDIVFLSQFLGRSFRKMALSFLEQKKIKEMVERLIIRGRNIADLLRVAVLFCFPKDFGTWSRRGKNNLLSRAVFEDQVEVVQAILENFTVPEEFLKDVTTGFSGRYQLPSSKCLDVLWEKKEPPPSPRSQNT